MNKERFHNALALSLGYERIVKDKRITIQVDDSDDPWVTLKFEGSPEVYKIKASESYEDDLSALEHENKSEFKQIVDAVQHAYAEALKPY
jgi:hypothetical protein